MGDCFAPLGPPLFPLDLMAHTDTQTDKTMDMASPRPTRPSGAELVKSLQKSLSFSYCLLDKAGGKGGGNYLTPSQTHLTPFWEYLTSSQYHVTNSKDQLTPCHDHLTHFPEHLIPSKEHMFPKKYDSFLRQSFTFFRSKPRLFHYFLDYGVQKPKRMQLRASPMKSPMEGVLVWLKDPGKSGVWPLKAI